MIGYQGSFPTISISSTGFITILIQRVPLVEQEPPTLPEHPSSPPIFSWVRVTRSLVLCVCFVDRCLSFCPFFFWPLCCLLFDLRLLIIPLVSLVLMIDYQTNVVFHINYIHYQYVCHLSNPPITFLYFFNPINCVTFYHLCRNVGYASHSLETIFTTPFKTTRFVQLMFGKPCYISEFKGIQAYRNRLGYCPSQTFQTC